MYYSLAAVVIGYFLDLLIGDPRWLLHPIRLIGFLINKTELICRKIFPASEKGELAAGVFTVFFVIFFSSGIPLLILTFAYKVHVILGISIESLMCFQLFATRSLKTESMKVYKKLRDGDVGGARKAVSMIVGRDTQSLDEKGITKAAVETVAENASDGVIAPMFYMIIGGAPLGFLYKSINTMDSMIGYKNDRYYYFGKAAAKLDDVVNLIPARICAYLMIFSTLFLGYDTRSAYKIYKRDKYNHASPNSAHTEAVMAGALKVQLAGDAYYFGKLHKKKTIGDDLRDIESRDIIRANRLMYATSLIAIIVFLILKGGILYYA